MKLVSSRLFMASTNIVLILLTLFHESQGTVMMYPQSVQVGGASSIKCSLSTVGVAPDVIKEINVIEEVSIGRVVAANSYYAHLAKIELIRNQYSRSVNLPRNSQWETPVADNGQIELLMFNIGIQDKGIYDCIVKYRLKLSNRIFVASRQEILSVDSQTADIVSDTLVIKGHLFTVTCDAERVIRNMRNDVNTIVELMISRAPGGRYSNTFQIIAWYKSQGTCYDGTPDKRDWEIRCYGANNGINNFNTMRLQMIVNDAEYGDNGEYECRVTYRLKSNYQELTNRWSQNITVSAASTGYEPFALRVTGETSIPLLLGLSLIAIIFDM